MLLLFAISLILIKYGLVTCVPAAVTSVPTTLEGAICPTTVKLTCTITDFTSLRWFVDGTGRALYVYTSSHNNFPRPPSVNTFPPGIDVQITDASRVGSTDNFNATSTLTTNTSVLQEFNMQNITCGTDTVRSELLAVDYTILGPPPPDCSTTCSLVTSASGLDVSLQWSSSFNSQHAVERYRVSVDPDPSSSCSSDQVVPSEDYSCPGLSPERNYSITVSANNCGDQEGESDTFTVLPQQLAPIPPYNIEVISENVIDANRRTQKLSIQWIESIPIPGRCLFYGVADYTLIFEGSAGEMVEVKVVSSDDSCINGSCSTSFSMASQPCRVSIMARNAFGQSNIVSADVYDCSASDDNYQEGLLAMGIMVGVLFLAVCASIGCIVFLADVPHVKTPEDTEGNAVMYDEIGMNHLMTAKEIPLTINSAYSSTNRNTTTYVNT